MTPQVINQIYWQMENQYEHGSDVTVDAHNQVDFDNDRMATNEIINHWESTQNWQANKRVPQLPMLAVGHRYRLMGLWEAEPVDTLTTRIIFYDIQGQELSRDNTTDHALEFEVPATTYSYQIELINGGCIHLHFRRLEICPADLPLSIHDDFFVEPIVGAQNQGHLITLLILANSAAKYIYTDFIGAKMPIQPVVVAYQNVAETRTKLVDWLVNHDCRRIVSLQAETDDCVLQAVKQDVTVRGIVNAMPHGELPYTVKQLAVPAMNPELKKRRQAKNWPAIIKMLNQLEHEEW